MKQIISKHTLGDITALYLNENGVVGLVLVPTSLPEDLLDLGAGSLTPLIKIAMPGGSLRGGYHAGLSLSESNLSYEFHFVSQTEEKSDGRTVITTEFAKDELILRHVLLYRVGDCAVETYTVFENRSGETQFLDLLTSFSLSCLTPIAHNPAETDLTLHRMRSYWSAEGKVESVNLDDLDMEPSWTTNGMRLEKFGQTGSMPVRRFFPFCALSDNSGGVCWAVSLGCSASWQIELYRFDEFLTLTGGYADYDFGHFRKTVEAGTSFRTPSAYLTVSNGGLDEASGRLSAYFSRSYAERHPEQLPLYFNEYCTTWGNPSHDNIMRILSKIQPLGFGYFVIDAGWYKEKNRGDWSVSGGDWNVSEELFTNGLDRTVAAIKSCGMKPGIWFEAEVAACNSRLYQNTDLLVHRDGVPYTVGTRRFLDTRKKEAQAYMREKITGFLKKYGFQYMKVDYNDAIGIGCDNNKASHSLGEGLYDVIEASKAFYRSVKEEIPGIMLEDCSSGGHRLEPALLQIFDVASFSDAHECVEIPIIAANLHRLMSPAQSQIWAVLRKTDSPKRLAWSILSGCLGALCISGDVCDLTEEQWDVVKSGIEFYRSVSDTIVHGTTAFFGPRIKKQHHPEGWQGIVRRNDNGKDAFVLVHQFGGAVPDVVEIPLGQVYDIAEVYCAGDVAVMVDGDVLVVKMKENYEAVGVRLVRR